MDPATMQTGRRIQRRRDGEYLKRHAILTRIQMARTATVVTRRGGLDLRVYDYFTDGFAVTKMRLPS